MTHRDRFSKLISMIAVVGLVVTMALSPALLGQSAEAARRGYDGPTNQPNGRVGTLTITWDWAGGQSCTAYATLAGWDANTTYSVEYAYVIPIRPVSGSVRLTTDANGAASGRVTAVIRTAQATFSVNGVIVQGFPDC